MKTVHEMQSIKSRTINYRAISARDQRAVRFRLNGELGFRIQRSIERIETMLPYSQEYILSQITAADGEWSNFPRVHGDIAGRWILAETFAHSSAEHVPRHLRSIVENVLDTQNPDGSFGKISFEEQPLNMHKAYGNGWMLKGLSQYAITFKDTRTKQAAVRLGDFYIKTLPVWQQAKLNERDTGYYAISISCYYHALDGLVTLYQLTADRRYLNLIEQFIPNLTPLTQADHSHMYLTIRRGLLAYYREVGAETEVEMLAQELQRVYDECLLETGGVPERFWLSEGEHADDEGCSLLDWVILTAHMFEVTQDTRWLNYAIFNLENQIFYNQTYNGGFGSCEINGEYKQQGKEAPWCCSVFGPYGLIESASVLVLAVDEDIIQINHLISGYFEFESGATIEIQKDDKNQTLTLRTEGTKSVRLYVPHWLNVWHDDGQQNGDYLHVDIPTSGFVDLKYEYKLWLSQPGRSPRQLKATTSGQEVRLFYGPWLLGHRFHREHIDVRLDVNHEGNAQGFVVESILGAGFYGETHRIQLSTDRPYNPNDTFLGVNEEEGDLYLYPIKDKESPNQTCTSVFIK